MKTDRFFLANYLIDVKCEKIVLAFNNHKNVLCRPENDEKFKKMGFSYFELPDNNSSQITQILDNICTRNSTRE